MMLIDNFNGSQQQRPRSAAQHSHQSQTSFAKFFQQNTVLDEKTVSAIWKGFGSYIAKELRNGRGVSIPKFGNFTFSSTLVDLAGTTNPGDRDKQQREPVFIVGKDFVSAVYLKSGVAAGGMTVRPFDNKGACGIIPKVKINFTEVAALCGQNKDTCRNGCEQVFRFLSDKARKGEQVQMEIPFVGNFLVRNNIAAIAFNQDLIEETRGVTPKNHFVNKLFSSSISKHNLQINDQVRAGGNIGLGGAIKLTSDAESWLKCNLNININDLGLSPYADQSPYINRNPEDDMRKPFTRQRPQSSYQQFGGGSTAKKHYESREEVGTTGSAVRRKSWQLAKQDGPGLLTEQNKHLFDQMSEAKAKIVTKKRPMSAYTRGSNNSRMTNVPDVGRVKLTIIASDIYKNRQSICDYQKSEGGYLRDTLSSSEIQKVLKNVGLHIEIGYIKALLKEIGFVWNGKSCSLMQLLTKCGELVNGGPTPSQMGGAFLTLNGQGQQPKPKAKPQQPLPGEEMLNKIKDLFYATKKSMYELFNEGKTGAFVEVQGLKKLVQKYSSGYVSEEIIEQAFKYASQGMQGLSYQDFEKVFTWHKPAGADWETRCIRAIREWMFKNSHSSETAFDMLLNKAKKVIQKKLNRVDFHLALAELDFKFNAPEVDALFKALDINQDGELDLEEWLARVYCDSQNPLQMLREIIQHASLTSDDILFRMNLRIWDAALDFPKFVESLRKLDPSLSESQLRVLAKTMKNKDGKVEVSTILTNLCGKEFETVDYRNKVFKKIYSQVFPSKEKRFMKLMEESDPLNDGKIEPAALKIALLKVTSDLDQETIDRFVRFLEKDTSGKVDYVAFIERMSDVGNKDHNPFKSIVQRIHFFLESNQQTVISIIKRLAVKCGVSYERGIPVEQFAQFLKAKIDKKRSDSELRKYAHYIDIDKDGFVSEIDLQTCINNLTSDAFFRDGGVALAQSAFSSQKKFFPTDSQMTPDRAFEIAKQIKAALIQQRIAYKEAFNRFDTNKDGFLSFTEFSQGLDTVMSLSLPVKEKLFAFLDKNQIGMVDYPSFLDIMQCTTAAKMKKDGLSDSFDWENSIIEQIKSWILKERITIEEAFKCFDRDFDGFVKREDLRWGIINILKVKEEEILPTKLDRLYRLMDFYKTGQMQLSDFQRLLNDQNPYTATTGGHSAAGTASSEIFKKSFGGSLGQTSTFDWKFSAMQQMGLVISKKFQSLKESFDDASEQLLKVTFEQFRKFIDKTQCLNGFNMTLPLTQKLFAELDPHKKGYLTQQDWLNAFQSFKAQDQILIELKNSLQCHFTDCPSAFQFFLSFKTVSATKQQQTITRSDFQRAVASLSSNRFSESEIASLWGILSERGKYITLDKYLFRQHFDNIQYQGFSTVVKPTGATGQTGRTTIVSVSSSNSQWESDIIEKLRQIMKTSSASLEEIFRQFDEDGNGSISQNEFRNAIRKLNLGLTSREIDKIMTRVDTNSDGKIDWQEFMAKFKSSELDERLKERARDRMARLKELMILHMVSPIDAFRYFDESKLGKLTYQEFSNLVIKAHELAGDKLPSYPVIKDLFDTIDIRKDGIIDINEWQQTFGYVSEGNNKLTIKSNPTTAATGGTNLSLWENTREYQRIGTLIAKNRKLLKDQFEKEAGAKNNNLVTYEQAKTAIMNLLQPHFNEITEEKLRVILRVGEVLGATEGGLGNRYDYNRLLGVYKNRHAAPQL